MSNAKRAAALARLHGADAIEVHSAGTTPGPDLNEESRASVEELGARFDGEYTKPIDPELLRRAVRTVVVGTEVKVEPVEGMAGTIEVWDVDEPSLRGIDGEERMRLIRDEIDSRVRKLIEELAH